MMTGKFRIIILIIYALLLLALVSRKGDLAAFVLPFLAYLWVGALRSPGEIRLAASRTLEKISTTAGKPIEIYLVVVNEGESIANLYVDDWDFSETQVRAGCASQRSALPAGRHVELRYPFQAKRGVYTWKTVHAAASDPLGLYQVQVEIPAASEFCVKPEIERLHPFRLQPHSTIHLAGSIPARLAGSGTDFWGVREYIPGDTLRSLNWRKSARQPNQLFTREFEQNEIMDIGLILDARALEAPFHTDEELFDFSIRAAASLAEIFLREGNRVGLLVFGNQLIHLFSGYGKKQLSRIIFALARAAPGKNTSLGGLNYVSNRLFPRRSLLVMISSLARNDLDVFTRLRAQGYQLLLVSPNPFDPASEVGRQKREVDMAIRVSRLERRLHLEQCLQKGIQVVDWQVSRPLNEAIQLACSPLILGRNLERRP
jgi:uncharacterized protein (DUF58 family)